MQKNIYILNLSFAVQRSDSRSAKLDELVLDAEKRVVDLSAAMLNASASSGSLSTTQQKVCSLFFSYVKVIVSSRFNIYSPHIDQGGC